MNGATHLIGGVTAAVALGCSSPSQLAVVAISSLISDIDRQNSLLGRFTPIVPSAIENIFGKRTLTHSLLFGGVIAYLLHLFKIAYFVPYLIGYLSHIVLDLFTGKIALFWPLPIRFGIPLFGIPPIFIESIALAGWGAWMVLGGYKKFILF